MKKSLNAVDLLGIISELGPLVGSIIDRVYSMGNSLLLRLRNPPEKYFIAANPHRFSLTRWLGEHGAEGVAGLRSLLEGSRIVNLELMGFDRVVRIVTNRGELIVELLEPWNVIYVENGIVAWCMRKYRGKDRVIEPHVRYVPPPKPFLEPTANPEELRKRNGTVSRVLARDLGLGTEVAREVCARAGVDPGSPAPNADWAILLSTLNELVSRVRSGRLEPSIYYTDNAPISVTPLRYISLSSYRLKSVSSFNEAVDEYFHVIEENEELARRVGRINDEVARLESSIADVERKISEFRKGAEELRRKAEALLRRKYDIEELMDNLRRYWLSDREEFPELIRDMTYEGIVVKSFDPQRKSLNMEVDGITVSVPLDLSVGSLVRELFDKAKELERKAETAKATLEELSSRLARLRREAENASTLMRENIVEVIYGAKEWFERFRWFVTSNNKPVIAGHNASQNEVLVRRYMRDWDIFLHADIPGGSVVIMRLVKGEEPSDDDVREAAQFAASYSKAWSMGLASIDVFYVRGNQVTKEAPSGEYLGRGSFMIYGNRGWVRGVELSISVGIRVDEVGNNRVVRLVAAPPSVIGKLASIYVTLRPGAMDRSRVSEEIRRILRREDVRITADQIINLIPGPSMIMDHGESSPMPWGMVREIFG